MIVLLIFASVDALKYMERSSFRTGVEELDSEVRINWRFGIAHGEADGQLRQKLLKKLLFPWLRMLDAVCDLHCLKFSYKFNYNHPVCIRTFLVPILLHVKVHKASIRIYAGEG